MPRITLTDDQKRKARVKDVKNLIRCELKDNHITHAAVAEKMGISQQGFGYKLNNMTFDLYELMLVLELINTKILIERGNDAD